MRSSAAGRKRCSDAQLRDWLAIAEALQVGRAEIMSAVHTNQPTGKRYETAMAQWLFARGFHLIDKCTRNHLFECHKHRVDIAKWLATMPEGERFKLNHPTTVLRRWKAATVVPVITKPKTLSPMAKLKEINVELQEKLHRAEREIERGGGDLWSSNDAPGDIAAVMINKLSTGKAEKVARAILAAVKVKKAAQAAVTPAPMRRETAACA